MPLTSPRARHCAMVALLVSAAPIVARAGQPTCALDWTPPANLTRAALAWHPAMASTFAVDASTATLRASTSCPRTAAARIDEALPKTRQRVATRVGASALISLFAARYALGNQPFAHTAIMLSTAGATMMWLWKH